MKERLVRMRSQLIPYAGKLKELTIIEKIFKLKIGKFYEFKELKHFIKETYCSKETLLEWKVLEKIENGINNYGNMTYLYKYNGFDNVIEEMEKSLEEDYQEMREFLKEQKEKQKEKTKRYFCPKDREKFRHFCLKRVDLSSLDKIRKYTEDENYYEITLD